MRISKMAAVLMFVGSVSLAGFGFAQTAAPATPAPVTPAPTTPAPMKMDDKGQYMQHLRDARKLINDAKVAFEKDPQDSANHRKEILEGIDKAIKAIDDEIDEYKADEKK